MRNGWPDLQRQPAPDKTVGDAQRAARPELGAWSRRDPDADIKSRPVIDYRRGGPGEIQPDPLAGLGDLFAK